MTDSLTPVLSHLRQLLADATPEEVVDRLVRAARGAALHDLRAVRRIASAST